MRMSQGPWVFPNRCSSARAHEGLRSSNSNATGSPVEIQFSARRVQPVKPMTLAHHTCQAKAQWLRCQRCDGRHYGRCHGRCHGDGDEKDGRDALGAGFGAPKPHPWAVLPAMYVHRSPYATVSCL